MKLLTPIIAVAAIAIVITGCYSRKERVVERQVERPVVRERVIESPSTTVQTPDATIRVK